MMTKIFTAPFSKINEALREYQEYKNYDIKKKSTLINIHINTTAICFVFLRERALKSRKKEDGCHDGESLKNKN